MTPAQLQTLHIHRRQLEQLDPSTFDRGWFDLVLLNIGRASAGADGRISSKGLSNAGFERVMAFLEETIASAGGGAALPGGKVGTYWRDRDRRRGHFLTTRQEWEIGRLYGKLLGLGLTYALGPIVSQMSGGRTRELKELNPAEAFKVIEMLKAAIERNRSAV